MSTSERNLRNACRTALWYLLVAGFCALFGGVYEHFSHGVYSQSMIYAFAYPLAGGAIPFLIIGLRFRPAGNEQVLYHCGIATLTLGSILEGVLEIYGTTNRLTRFYPWAGWLLVGSGVLIRLIYTFRKKP